MNNSTDELEQKNASEIVKENGLGDFSIFQLRSNLNSL